MAADSLAVTLARIAGEAHVLTDPARMTAYETDWTRRWRGRAVRGPAGGHG